MVLLLSESFNPYVRCGTAMALGIACAGTGSLVSGVLVCAYVLVIKSLCLFVFTFLFDLIDEWALYPQLNHIV